MYEALDWTEKARTSDYADSGSLFCSITLHNHVVELALARGDNAKELVMQGALLARRATLNAEPASAIAGASSRKRSTMHERPRQTGEITTKSLGQVAGQCAGPTARSCGFTIDLAPSRMRSVSYIRAANESLKRSSDLRTLAPLAII